MLPIKDKITVVTAGHGGGHGSGLAETAVATALVTAVIAVIAVREQVIEAVAVAVTAREQRAQRALRRECWRWRRFRGGAQASVLIGATLRGRCDHRDRDFGLRS